MTSIDRTDIPILASRVKTHRGVISPGAVIGMAAASVLLFIIYSAMTYSTGFPLDDAWIHQTYARNLAQRFEWAFLPGVPSAGSTSPLWTLLLAPGHVGLIAPFSWTILLGILSFSGLALFGERLFRMAGGEIGLKLPLAGLFLATEWHLVWAAASGMETMLFAMWIVGTFYLLSHSQPRWMWIGLLAGTAAWIRPDGVTLLGPAFFVLVLSKPFWRARFTGGIWVILGFAIGFAPYLLFNRMISGSFLPNTFYAKQAEYAIYQQIPLVERFLSLAVLPLIGAGILLLPGAVYCVWRAIRQKQVIIVTMCLWWVGYTGLYALRLPVTYQHGRYLIPAMPIYFILGLIGTAWIIQRINRRGRLQFVFTRGLASTILAVNFAFLILGAQQYSQDVAIIETEMVRTAKWVALETEPNALIAAHDIGALGYYGQRNLLDLAGLISPEVIPFIRDEERLSIYLDESKVDYLITFPDWYPLLTERAESIYQTEGSHAIEAGGENMVVYRWRIMQP
jgi:hypothetical protein